jgi:F-type H+-transporting ATPase subunit gamma
MPANLKDLRNRIKSVVNTQQMTKAMKLVSAAKFSKAQHSFLASASFVNDYQSLFQVMGDLLPPDFNHPVTEILEDKKTALVFIISSERGLCGAYNTNVSKQALKLIKDLKDKGLTPVPVFFGKKAYQLLSKKIEEVIGHNYEQSSVSFLDFVNTPESFIGENRMVLLTDTFAKLDYKWAKSLAEALTKVFLTKKLRDIYVIYNKFQSAMTQTPFVNKMLPVAFEAKAHKAEYAEPKVEAESLEAYFEQFIKQYLESQMYEIFLNTVASEHGARMSSMDNATRNAKEMERKLRITYQRARQASITKELIEIISGAEAL